jgi:hypothetical protein
VTVTEGVPKEVQDEAGVPINKISSILTPCDPPEGDVHLNFSCEELIVPKFHVPAEIIVEDVGVAEVNVVVLQVEPLSAEYSTKQE